MNSNTLFNSGNFISHSGLEMPFKIDCDALSDQDIQCIAEVILAETSFGVVLGIPGGGCRLAKALEPYAVQEAPFNILIVDDVLTTGSSMEEHKAAFGPLIHPDDIIGWVIFARNKPPDWVHALFRMDDLTHAKEINI